MALHQICRQLYMQLTPWLVFKDWDLQRQLSTHRQTEPSMPNGTIRVLILN